MAADEDVDPTERAADLPTAAKILVGLGAVVAELAWVGLLVYLLLRALS